MINTIIDDQKKIKYPLYGFPYISYCASKKNELESSNKKVREFSSNNIISIIDILNNKMSKIDNAKLLFNDLDNNLHSSNNNNLDYDINKINDIYFNPIINNDKKSKKSKKSKRSKKININ